MTATGQPKSLLNVSRQASAGKQERNDLTLIALDRPGKHEHGTRERVLIAAVRVPGRPPTHLHGITARCLRSRTTMLNILN
jgi:hypothetical protein